MILPIVAYGDPVLRKVAKEIDADYPNLSELIENMKQTMYNASGVGIAAPQIGKSIRLFIIDATPFAEDEELSEEFLLDIHRTITKDTLPDADVGSFRSTNDIVVGDSVDPDKIYHHPPDHKDLPELMKAFYHFASRDDEEFIHPVIKGIALHFLIGYIHPFNDGNGRTARTVFYWYLLSRGYWLFQYMAISRRILRSKKEYGTAYLYTETDENDLTYFINYNVISIKDALDDMLMYIRRKQKEQREAQKLLGKLDDINLRQADILERIMKNQGKYFSIQEIAAVYDVVYQTARNDLFSLARKQYITQRKISRSYAFFFTEENRLALSNLESKKKSTQT